MAEVEQLTEEAQEVEEIQEVQDFITSLRDFMDEKEVQALNIEVEDSTFGVTTKEQANFFAKKLQEAREQAAEINRFAEAEIARNAEITNVWRERELSTISGQMTYLIGQLETYARNELQDSTKKSVKLPYGTLQLRAQQDKYEYDDTALVPFLEANPGLKTLYVQYKPSAKKAELKKVGTVKDGVFFVGDVALPGITVTKQDDKFEVK